MRKSRDEIQSSIQVRIVVGLSLLSISIIGLLAAPVPSGKPANYPGWWFSQGIITQNDTNSSPAYPADYPAADDYSAINQGQLKNFATQAYAELQADLPPYALTNSYGTNLASLVNSWNPTNGDAYAAVNLGQLKTVGAAFYNVLISAGYTNNYPWTGVGADDYAAANIGQAKYAFSFDTSLDTNALPYWWETKYFGQTGLNPYSDPDGNGASLISDYQSGANPTNYYSEPNGSGGSTTITPAISITSGNFQTNVPTDIIAAPITVTVVNSSTGAALPYAPVNFSVVSGGGNLVTSSAVFTNTCVVSANSSGQASIYYQQPSATNTVSQISATASGESVTVTESTQTGDNSFDAPSNLVASPSGPSSVNLTWVNHASSATSILIDQSIDGVNWTTIATISDPTTTSYTVNGLSPDYKYEFSVCPAK